MDQTDAYTNILRIKKKFRELNQQSCYFKETQVVAVERYSDQVSKLKKEALSKWKPGKCKRKQNIDQSSTLNNYDYKIDWDRLPKELKYFYEKEEKDVMKKKRKSTVKPTLVKRKLSKIDLKTLEVN